MSAGRTSAAVLVVNTAIPTEHIDLHDRTDRIPFDKLAEEFSRGAREAGNQVEKIELYDKTIGFCKGCLACQKTLRCVIHAGEPMPLLPEVQKGTMVLPLRS